MIVDPPFETGAVNATVAVEELFFVAAPMVGAPGTIGSVTTELDATDAAEMPMLFVAVTVKV